MGLVEYRKGKPNEGPSELARCVDRMEDGHWIDRGEHGNFVFLLNKKLPCFMIGDE